jgi:hypothetical protein
MDQASAFVQENKGVLTSLAFLAVILAILYAVYQYLYPPVDPNYTSFLQGDADARKGPVAVDGQVPAIYTGGDFTLSFWMYIDDFNYRASSYKHVLAIAPESSDLNSTYPLVIGMTPLTNGLLVRTNNLPGSAQQSNINTKQGLENLMKNNTSTSMFTSTVDQPCDVKDVPIQRWVCVTVVSSGRLLDVYMDGKLGRSCMLDSTVYIPTHSTSKNPLKLRLCDYGGFGGRISTVQMWSASLTPDVIYGIYAMGPTPTEHNIFTKLAQYLHLNVRFTGSSPGGARKALEDNSCCCGDKSSSTTKYLTG